MEQVRESRFAGVNSSVRVYQLNRAHAVFAGHLREPYGPFLSLAGHDLDGARTRVGLHPFDRLGA